MSDTYGISDNFILSTFVLAAGLLSVVFLAVALLILRWLLRGLLRFGRLYTSSPAVGLLSFALAAYLFPIFITGVLLPAATLLLSLATTLPSSLSSSLGAITEGCRAHGDRCILAVIFALLGIWQRFWDNASSTFALKALLVLESIFFFAAWGTVSAILDSLHKAGAWSQFQDAFGRVCAWLTTLDDRARSMAILIVLLIVSAYLSIAAVVAVPSMRRAELPTEVSTENLKTRLQQSVLQKQQFDQMFPASLGESPLSSLAEQLAPDQSTNARLYASFIQIQIDQRRHLLDQWNRLRTDVFDGQTALLETAISTYQLANIDRIGSREGVQHFLLVDEWYRGRLTTSFENLTRCLNRIGELDSAARMLSSLSYVFLDPSLGTSVNPALESYTKTLQGAGTGCESVAVDLRVPARPEPGSNLGPFSYVSRWLIKTESMALVVITGMLGFGLLGAAVSSFVRRGGASDGESQPVRDLGGVMLRGTSAAVVVFLGVYGGLSTYSTGTVDPNPYMMLFTCLVAAVFSETVWNWAHRRLRSGLGHGQPPAAGDSIPAEDSTAPANTTADTGRL